MNWLTKHYKAWLIIVLSLVIAYFSKLPVGNWLLQKKIHEDISVISQLYSGLYSQGFAQMDEISERAVYRCNDYDMELMSRAKANNLFVSYVDLHLKGGGSCSIYNIDRSTFPLVQDPPQDLVKIGKVILLLKNHQFEEMRLENELGTIRFRFQQPKNLITNCDKCLYMMIQADGREIQLYESSGEEYDLVYTRMSAYNTPMRFFINERGVDHVVGDLTSLFSAMVALCGVLLAIGIELRQSDKKGLGGLLNEAIDKGHLKPFYQPIVMPTPDGYRIMGAEVLMRWITETGDIIPPNTFIPLAEQNGAIDRITDQLIDNVLIDMQQVDMPGDFSISVNVSPSYLEKADAAEKILRKITRTGLRYSHLSLEITERTQFSDLKKAAVCIEMLREKGISIKLDDCGTGYGAFSYLHTLNIDTIKIDRMFVKSIGIEDFKNNILNSILAFARESNLHVVAEGIETKAQADFLIDSGVELFQGSYFGDPVPFEEFFRHVEFDNPPPTQKMAI